MDKWEYIKEQNELRKNEERIILLRLQKKINNILAEDIKFCNKKALYIYIFSDIEKLKLFPINI